MSNPFSRTARSEACRFLKQRLREQAKADDQNGQRNDNNEQENAVHDCQCQRSLNRSPSMGRNDARFVRVEREVVQPRVRSYRRVVRAWATDAGLQIREAASVRLRCSVKSWAATSMIAAKLTVSIAMNNSVVGFINWFSSI